MPTPVPRKGVFAALWLPTDAEGNLLRDALARNLAFMKSRGIYGVLALGSKESMRFSPHEDRYEQLSGPEKIFRKAR